MYYPVLSTVKSFSVIRRVSCCKCIIFITQMYPLANIASYHRITHHHIYTIHIHTSSASGTEFGVYVGFACEFIGFERGGIGGVDTSLDMEHSSCRGGSRIECSEECVSDIELVGSCGG